MDGAYGTGQIGFVPQVCPDLSQMEKIPGYENLTFNEEINVPPTAPDWQPNVDNENRMLKDLPVLTEAEVRDAVTQYASEHCCYGKSFSRDMIITNINMMSVLHYTMESLGEKRESAWRFEPYRGQPIDGPMNGPAPLPWDIVVTPPVLFQNATCRLEVPHTAFVKPCHACVGNGRVRCDDCQGRGQNQCTWCNGRGFERRFDNNEPCTSCNTSGFRRCTWCSGTGQKECKTCNGKCQLKGYVELIVIWTNHVDDYISETSSMPKELVRSVSGQTVFEEENPRVYPIVLVSNQAVQNASCEYVNKHKNFVNERVLKQRQTLRVVPVAEVSYIWKENPGQFFVYGCEHKVYFKEYPQKCCCCIIL